MDSSQDEIGASAILGAQLDEELGGGPVQVKMFFLSFFWFSLSPPSSMLYIPPPQTLSLSVLSYPSLMLLLSLVFGLFYIFRLSVLLSPLRYFCLLPPLPLTSLDDSHGFSRVTTKEPLRLFRKYPCLLQVTSGQDMFFRAVLI